MIGTALYRDVTSTCINNKILVSLVRFSMGGITDSKWSYNNVAVELAKVRGETPSLSMQSQV